MGDVRRMALGQYLVRVSTALVKTTGDGHESHRELVPTSGSRGWLENEDMVLGWHQLADNSEPRSPPPPPLPLHALSYIIQEERMTARLRYLLQ